MSRPEWSGMNQQAPKLHAVENKKRTSLPELSIRLGAIARGCREMRIQTLNILGSLYPAMCGPEESECKEATMPGTGLLDEIDVLLARAERDQKYIIEGLYGLRSLLCSDNDEERA